MATQNLRFVVGLLATLCLGMAVASADAQPAAGIQKPDDQPATKDVLPRENAPAAPSPAHDNRSARKDANGEIRDHALTNKGKSPPAKDGDTPQTRMKDLGPVDTRITVLPPQPHRSDERKPNPPLHLPPGLRTQPPDIRRPGGTITRNSIGEAVPSSPQPPARASSQGSSPGAVAPAVTDRGGGPGNAAAAPGNPALAPFHARPITTAPAASRSTIDGTSIAHGGNVPASIGGQAKPLGGINGSTIRPKH